MTNIACGKPFLKLEVSGGEHGVCKERCFWWFLSSAPRHAQGQKKNIC
jgi:hypothetical protein